MSPGRRLLAALLALLLFCAPGLAEPWHDTAEALAGALTEASYPLRRLEAADAAKVTFTGGSIEVFVSAEEAEAALAAFAEPELAAARMENVLLLRRPSEITSHYEAALAAILAGEGVPAYDAAAVREEQVLETLVWIPTGSGRKYHDKASCSNMKAPELVTVREAIARGFSVCKRCKPPAP